MYVHVRWCSSTVWLLSTQLWMDECELRPPFVYNNIRLSLNYHAPHNNLYYYIYNIIYISAGTLKRDFYDRHTYVIASQRVYSHYMQQLWLSLLWVVANSISCGGLARGSTWDSCPPPPFFPESCNIYYFFRPYKHQYQVIEVAFRVQNVHKKADYRIYWNRSRTPNSSRPRIVAAPGDPPKK